MRRSGGPGRLAVAWTLGLVLALPDGAAAQRLAVDAEVVGGTASLAWEVSPGSSLGFGLGLTFPQINQTLRPDTARLEEYLHAAGFYRRRAGVLEADVGVRLSVADLYECYVSDCWPGLFAGGYGAVFVGWEHVKVGARLVAGTQDEPGRPRTFVVALTPLLVRIAFGR